MKSTVNRRQVLTIPLALGLPSVTLAQGYSYGSSPSAAAAPAVASGKAPKRFALLVGNRAYPSPFDLPPVHKNLRDVQAVLEKRGFEVTVVTDQDVKVLRDAMQSFAKRVQAAPADATVLFYFTGHGMQVDAENLLLGAGTNPSGKEDSLLGNGLMLKRDLVDALPHRPKGLSMVVIDACRTSLRAEGGLNQVEAPLGCLIAFATGAGKPAIAPAVETQNTFYTASLVKVMQAASDDTTFSDLFRLVKLDVQQTMLNHPIQAIRNVAQFPFIAENTQIRTRLALKPAAPGGEVAFENVDEKTLWKQVEESYWPGDVVKRADEYLKRFPGGKLAGSAQVAREGATDAAKAMQRNDVRLFKSAFSPKPESPDGLLRELRKAAWGDKDAAARIARMYRRGEDGVSTDSNRFEGWMQFASALGNGIASYELALYYRGQDQPLLAAQFESRARELGYTPPPTLDHYRK
ncbi:caspase family protein [Aquabacterium sp.]|uniref:caspase family protein n=1 Tax=Aquabacterium sp. TaxID=1872578 RepID=UPI0024898EC7|nr:caspase family protein [Aquabacterium sp.]MDI1258123.1 caspase family protein [Aquabacterium sp.]